jgi:hypothetical protein
LLGEIDQATTSRGKDERKGIPRGEGPTLRHEELALSGPETSLRDKGTVLWSGDTILRGAVVTPRAATIVVDLDSPSEEKDTKVDSPS